MAVFRVDLSGKVAVVSGGSSGMGAAIARQMGMSGAAVVVGGRDEGRTNAVADEIVVAGGQACAVLGDVSDSAHADRIVRETVARFGRLDIVVNAAGVMHRGDAPGTDDQQWRRVMSTNVDGTFFLSRAAIGPMRDGGGGSIINISSTVGLVGSVNGAAYSASKGAVTNLTRAMALDHAADGIRINAICPGATNTPMLGSGHATVEARQASLSRIMTAIPQGRAAQPEEIADLALFLASDASQHITGTNIPIDGGYTIH